MARTPLFRLLRRSFDLARLANATGRPAAEVIERHLERRRRAWSRREVLAAVRFHWPTFEWTKGSYACYLPGQWTRFGGAEGERVGNLHFCGEHTSVDFQGYMEGAAESGERAAAEILADLGIALGEEAA